MSFVRENITDLNAEESSSNTTSVNCNSEPEESSSNTSSINHEIHNYPSSKKIIYKKPNHTFNYEIIKEGHYPNNVKYTQSNGKASPFPIPDEYLVKTEYGKMEKHILNCSIKYNNQNPEFYLSWKDRENQHHQVNSKTTPTKAAQKYLEVFSICVINTFKIL